MKQAVHMEIAQKSSSNLKKEEIEQYVRHWMLSNGPVWGRRQLEVAGDAFLAKHVEMMSAQFCDNEMEANDEMKSIDESEIVQQFHIYRLDNSGPQQEEMGEEESVSAATHWILPSKDLHGLWDSLIYESSVKDELLNFAMSAIMFSDRGVREHIVGLNRVVLLHGPPGTGKTSLCRALAHKLAIRLSSRFAFGQLIEINSHSLFSKWFSESGKLVMRMFSRIHELVEESRAIVCVLIDEVESLAHARASSQGGTEPSDSLRAVNALLTQIDSIRRYPNVIILTTSNVTSAIDLAFVDRADIKKYIGLPTAKALYRIYHSCLTELMRTEIIYPKSKLLQLKQFNSSKSETQSTHQLSHKLMEVAKKSEGLSGRNARKIPFLAHATYLQRPQCTLEEYIEAMDRAVEQEFIDRKLVSAASNTSASTSNGTH